MLPVQSFCTKTNCCLWSAGIRVLIVRICIWRTHTAPESPEARKSIKDNRFKPQWVEIADLPDIPMYVWQNVRMQLLHDLRLGFPEAPLELA
jgi:hypothetical protein